MSTASTEGNCSTEICQHVDSNISLTKLIGLDYKYKMKQKMPISFVFVFPCSWLNLFCNSLFIERPYQTWCFVAEVSEWINQTIIKALHDALMPLAILLLNHTYSNIYRNLMNNVICSHASPTSHLSLVVIPLLRVRWIRHYRFCGRIRVGNTLNNANGCWLNLRKYHIFRIYSISGCAFNCVLSLPIAYCS